MGRKVVTDEMIDRMVELREERSSTQVIVETIHTEFGQLLHKNTVLNCLKERELQKCNIEIVDKKYLLKTIIKLYIGEGKTVKEIQVALKKVFGNGRSYSIKISTKEIEDLLKEASVYIPKGVRLSCRQNEEGRTPRRVIQNNFGIVYDAYCGNGNLKGMLSTLHVWRDLMGVTSGPKAMRLENTIKSLENAIKNQTSRNQGVVVEKESVRE